LTEQPLLPIGVQFVARCGGARRNRVATLLERARPWFERRSALG
jgi:hypothetical protein